MANNRDRGHLGISLVPLLPSVVSSRKPVPHCLLTSSPGLLSDVSLQFAAWIAAAGSAISFVMVLLVVPSGESLECEHSVWNLDYPLPSPHRTRR